MEFVGPWIVHDHYLLQKSQHLRLLFIEQYMNSNRVLPKRVKKKKKKKKKEQKRKTQTGSKRRRVSKLALSVQPIGHHFGHLPWKGGFLPIEFFWTSFLFFFFFFFFFQFFELPSFFSPNKRVLKVFQLPFYFIFFPNKSLWIILSIFLNFLFYFFFSK